VLGKSHAGNTQFKSMHFLRVHPRQLSGQEIALLLIVSLMNNPVARLNYNFKQFHGPICGDDLSSSESLINSGNFAISYFMFV
jgi:hypothetical protein